MYFNNRMLYTISDIQTILGAVWLQIADPDAGIRHLLYDSRQVHSPAGSLFFALPGKRHDGHAHLEEVYQAGVRNLVVGKKTASDAFPGANVLLVDNTLHAMQALAAHHRAQFRYPVIGITGSNGKTIVKEWLFQLLAPDYDIVRSPKSYNSQIGVPLSVWEMQEYHTLGIFEAGISQPGEMERLAAIIRPDVGILTNIGPAHREGFASEAEKLQEKMKLFAGAKALICCADPGWPAPEGGMRVVSWSRTGKPADVQIGAVRRNPDGSTSVELVSQIHGTETAGFILPFSDEASVENALHCWVTARWLGVPAEAIRARMAGLEPVEMRLELKAGVNRSTLINDAYNNDLNSFLIALQYAGQQARIGRFTVILSDILQSGMPNRELYSKVAAALKAQKVDRLVGIGDNIRSMEALLPKGMEASFYSGTGPFMDDLRRYDFSDALILLKGARPFAFERIAQRLEQKNHKTVLEVNLNSLVHNLNAYHAHLRPGTKMMAMVKAAAYGSGSTDVARLLEFHKVDYLGVAYTDEGVELRQAGIRLPILVLNPEASGFDAIYRYRLEPEVFSLGQLEELIRYAGTEKALSIHLKLDTGMHRLGFEPKDLEALIVRLAAHPNLRVQSVFSHLAASDAAAHDDFTHRQASVFQASYETLKSGLGYAPLRHLLNTGGIDRFPQYQFEMVRLGIGLYGIGSGRMKDALRVVNTLKATISQVKEVSAGETVGYNRNGPVTHASRIATISIGYADGFLRLAGNGRYEVMIHGQKAPTIGNVCMDMTMVDVTGIPEAREGDEVLIFGEQLPVQELALTLQTIPYEVFTNISARVKRVYWQE